MFKKFFQHKLRMELTASLVIKFIVIFFIWWFFFSHPVPESAVEKKIHQIYGSPTSANSI